MIFLFLLPAASQNTSGKEERKDMSSQTSGTTAGKEITCTACHPIPTKLHEFVKTDPLDSEAQEPSETSPTFSQCLQKQCSKSSSHSMCNDDSNDCKNVDPMISSLNHLLTHKKSWKDFSLGQPPSISPCVLSVGESCCTPPLSSPQESLPAVLANDDRTPLGEANNTTQSSLLYASLPSCPAHGSATSVSSDILKEEGDKKYNGAEEGGECEIIAKKKPKGRRNDKKGAEGRKKSGGNEEIVACKVAATPIATESVSSEKKFPQSSRSHRSFFAEDGGERKEDAGSSNGHSPHKVEVPLITPRYQHRHRVFNQMNVTDSNPNVQSPTSLLSNRTTECLTIQQGPMEYTEEVHFHAYDIFRHQKGKIHTRSVGYSDDGDLVMMREDMLEVMSDVEAAVRRKAVIYNSTVLNPSAQAPPTDSDLPSRSAQRVKKKYPGIHAPRNKKIRNRLRNDCFVSDEAKPLLEQAREYEKEAQESGGKEEVHTPKLFFGPLPPSLELTFDVQNEKKKKAAEKYWSQKPKQVPIPLNPNSPESRLQLLNTRLRAELQRALNSEFLSRQMEDLEANFTLYICSSGNESSKKSLVFNFQDGYGRLICHGIATYYGLLSHSVVVDEEGGTCSGSVEEQGNSVKDRFPLSFPSSPPGVSGKSGVASKVTYVSLPQRGKKRRKKAGNLSAIDESDAALELPQVPLMQWLRPRTSARRAPSASSTSSESSISERMSSATGTSTYSMEHKNSAGAALSPYPGEAESYHHKEGNAEDKKDTTNSRRHHTLQDEERARERYHDEKARHDVSAWAEQLEAGGTAEFFPSAALSPSSRPSRGTRRSATPLCSLVGSVTPSPFMEVFTDPSQFSSSTCPRRSPHHTLTIPRSSHDPHPSSSVRRNSPSLFASCPLAYNSTIVIVEKEEAGGGQSPVLKVVPPLYEPQLCLHIHSPCSSFSSSCSSSSSTISALPPPFFLPPAATIPDAEGSHFTSATSTKESGDERNGVTTTMTMTNVSAAYTLSEGPHLLLCPTPSRDRPIVGKLRKEEKENLKTKEGGDATATVCSVFSEEETLRIRERLADAGLSIRSFDP